MSRQTALTFLSRCRRDPALQQKLRDLPAPVAMDDLVRLAIDSGFSVDASSLAAAFDIDWTMRAIHRAD